MRISLTFKNTIVEIICLLYILLFVYAAVSKLLDFENFRVQLGQSPLLSAFAGFISWIVPLLELFIVLLIVIKRWRIVGLFCALSLMIMFTAYIFIILNYSSFIPCSCGGILEKMGWKEHFLFNSVFIMLAASGILILAGGVPKAHLILKPAALASSFSITVLCSIGIVALLFMLSEDIIHHRNNFVRRFPHHPVMIKHQTDLGQFTYYLAGISGDKIYVANSLAPLAMTVIDTSLVNKQSFRIALAENTMKFRSVRVMINDSTFYLSDGTVPVIFDGNVKDWKAAVWMRDKAFFTHIQPLSNNKIAIRAVDTQRQNVLGSISLDNDLKVKLSNKLLEKQIDGDFDTDGSFLYNSQLKRIVYTYFYRNQFIVADTSLNLDYRGNTIDTTTKARIKVATVKSRNERKLSSPPYIVNKRTATFGKYLFVHAGLIGKYEPQNVWETASIIDVYDLRTKTYAFSFYINDENGEKLTDFKVSGNLLVAIFGRTIAVYRIKSSFFQNYGIP